MRSPLDLSPFDLLHSLLEGDYLICATFDCRHGFVVGSDVRKLLEFFHQTFVFLDI